MRIEVRYYSKNGGTKKLAEAIGQALDTEAKTVDVKLEKYADVVFLGSSVYKGKPDPAVVKFIADNAKNIGKIVVFGSAGTKKSTFPAIKSAAAGNAVKTAEMFFQCKGEFLFLNKGRPNDQDCRDAADFAKKQIKILGVT
ncbi:MAG: flavodoxin family protein [Clostridia bacterium]|nr:flavodoxin family protein [Clostridia bacterium]